MKLSEFIGKAVNIEGVSQPVVLKSVNGQAAYVNDEGETVVLGRLSDSVGRGNSTVKVSLSRISG